MKIKKKNTTILVSILLLGCSSMARSEDKNHDIVYYVYNDINESKAFYEDVTSDHKNIKTYCMMVNKNQKKIFIKTLHGGTGQVDFKVIKDDLIKTSNDFYVLLSKSTKYDFKEGKKVTSKYYDSILIHRNKDVIEESKDSGFGKMFIACHKDGKCSIDECIDAFKKEEEYIKKNEKYWDEMQGAQ